MSTFVIYVKARQELSCNCCAEPAVWELYGSNRPHRKLGACDTHREEVRMALVEALDGERSLWPDSQPSAASAL